MHEGLPSKFVGRFYGLTSGGRVGQHAGGVVGSVLGPVLLDGAFVLETGNYFDADGNLVDTSIRRFLVSVIYRH